MTFTVELVGDKEGSKYIFDGNLVLSLTGIARSISLLKRLLRPTEIKIVMFYVHFLQTLLGLG